MIEGPDISADELLQLDELECAFVQDKITWDDYIASREAILRGRTPPLRSTPSQHERRRSDNASSAGIKPLDLRALTTCPARSRRARQRQFEKALLSSKGMRTVGSSDSNEKRERRRVRLMPQVILGDAGGAKRTRRRAFGLKRPERYPELVDEDSSIFFSPGGGEHTRRSQLLPLAFTGLVALGLTFLIGLSGPINGIVTALQPYNASARSAGAVDIASVPLRPLFGPVALQQCVRSCGRLKGPEAALCETGCNSFSLEEYARRILPSDPNPTADAGVLRARCRASSRAELASDNRTAWRETIAGAVSALRQAPRDAKLRSFGLVRMIYNTTMTANLALTLPIGATANDRALVAVLSEATCLRVNLALAELGMLLSQQNRDGFSRRYYYSLYKALFPETYRKESEALTAASGAPGKKGT